MQLSRRAPGGLPGSPRLQGQSSLVVRCRGQGSACTARPAGACCVLRAACCVQGSNVWGQLGVGHNDSVQGLQPVSPGPNATWRMVRVGVCFACGIRQDDQALLCWASGTGFCTALAPACCAGHALSTHWPAALTRAGQTHPSAVPNPAAPAAWRGRQVPWRKVAAFEFLLANDKAPVADKASAAPSAAADKAGPTVWEQRMRWAKVGAAAVGGGALFALTGEQRAFSL